MRVGLIGLGTMGTHFATHLLAAGYDLVVHDLSMDVAQPHLDAGARWATSARDVAEQCQIVMTSLPGPSDVESIALNQETGLLAGLSDGDVYFDLSTNSPTAIRKVHAELLRRDIHVLDAPVSGGPAGARSGKLAIWVGGDRAIFDAHRAPLDAIGDQVRYIGEIGAGSVAKLVHNASGYAIQTVLAEMFSVGVKAGVEPLSLWEAVRQGAHGRTRTFDKLAEHFLINEYDPPAFALKLAHKDVTLAAQMGDDQGVDTPMIDKTLAEMTHALERGWGQRDSRVSMLLALEKASVDIAVPAQQVKAVIDSDTE